MVNDRVRIFLVTTTKDIQHLPEHIEATLADTLALMEVRRHAIGQEVVNNRYVSDTTTRAAPDGNLIFMSGCDCEACLIHEFVVIHCAVNMVDNLFIRYGNFINPHFKENIAKQLFTVFVHLAGTRQQYPAFLQA